MSALLRGIVVGRDADRLIVQASAADIAQFSAPMPVSVVGSSQSALMTAWADDGMLYDSTGRRVAMIIEIQYAYQQPQIDVTMHSEPYAMVVPGGLHGLPNYRLTARGPV